MKSKSVVRASALQGFTLIELLVTIVIVGILVAVDFGAFNRSVLKAGQVEAQSLGGTLGIGTGNYRDEDFWLPNPPGYEEWDLVYGDPDGLHGMSLLTAVLAGGEVSFQEHDGRGGAVDAGRLNSNRTQFGEPSMAQQLRTCAWEEDDVIS